MEEHALQVAKPGSSPLTMASSRAQSTAGNTAASRDIADARDTASSYGTAASRAMMMRPAAVPVKLVALVCAIATSSLASMPGSAGLLSLFALLYLALQRRLRLAAISALSVAVLGALLLLIRFAGLRMVVFSEFYVLLFWSLSPVFLVAWDLVTTPPGELSSFLSRVHAPTPVILGVLVVFRFFPTMRAAVVSVGESMKNRGLSRAAFVLRHPLLVCEFVAIPLLLRCLQVADRLAASAVVRGAEAPGTRTSYCAHSFGWMDGLWMGAWCAATAILFAVAGVR